jgi:hypothetical protein
MAVMRKPHRNIGDSIQNPQLAGSLRRTPRGGNTHSGAARTFNSYMGKQTFMRGAAQGRGAKKRGEISYSLPKGLWLTFLVQDH